jgi:hypothetical protein
MGRRPCSAHICLVRCSVWGLMVNFLRPGALDMVFLSVILFISFVDVVSGEIHFCRFDIYADALQI